MILQLLVSGLFLLSLLIFWRISYIMERILDKGHRYHRERNQLIQLFWDYEEYIEDLEDEYYDQRFEYLSNMHDLLLNIRKADGTYPPNYPEYGKDHHADTGSGSSN